MINKQFCNSTREQETLPSGYRMVTMAVPEKGEYAITIRDEELDQSSGLPIIKRNLTIYSNLHYKMHIGGTEVPVPTVRSSCNMI